MKEMMGRKKVIAVYMAIFWGLLGFLWLLLVCAAAIPNETLKGHMEESALSYKEKEAFSFERGKKWNGISDNYADTILLNVSWNMGKGNPLLSSLDTWYYSGEGFGENAGLYLAVTEGAEPDTDYTRYWHGSAVFVRLFHLIMDVKGIKRMGFLAAMGLAAVTVAMLFARKHYDIGMGFLLSMGAVQIWNIGLSLEYEPAFVICFLLCPLYLWTERMGDGYITCLSLAGGVLIAFFDFLTTETAVLLVPLILVIAVRTKEKRLGDGKKSFCMLFLCGICWGFAYMGTFLVKWAAASLVTGENKFLLALSSAGERVNGALPGEHADGLARIPMAVAANLTMMFYGEARVEPLRVAAGMAVSFLILGSVLYLFHKKKGNGTGIRMLLLPGGVVLLRYMVLSNHSYLHEFFTYRALISPVLAVFLSLALSTELPAFGRRKRSRKRGRTDGGKADGGKAGRGKADRGKADREKTDRGKTGDGRM